MMGSSQRLTHNPGRKYNIPGHSCAPAAAYPGKCLVRHRADRARPIAIRLHVPELCRLIAALLPAARSRAAARALRRTTGPEHAENSYRSTGRSMAVAGDALASLILLTLPKPTAEYGL